MGGVFFLRLKKLSQSTAKHTTDMCSSFDETRRIKTCRSSTKNRPKYRRLSSSEIIKDLSRSRVANFYEYGIVEAIDPDDFNAKLDSLEDQWEVLCPEFHQWFVRDRKSLFLEKRHLISKAQFGFYEPLLSK